jgi:hypothetical protein
MKRRSWVMWGLLFVFGFVLLSGGCGGGGSGSGDSDGYDVIPGDTTLDDVWEKVAGSVSGTATIDSVTGYTISDVEITAFALDFTDGSALSSGKMDVELKWTASNGSNTQTFTTTIKDEAATLTETSSGVYQYNASDGTEITLTLNADGTLSVQVVNSSAAITTEAGVAVSAYAGNFEVGGFLAALEGTWIGSNGSASGTVEGYSGTATLVDGTARLDIVGVLWNKVYVSGSVDSTWDVSAGGYTERVNLGGGAFVSVSMERLGANKFRFTYQAYGETDTVVITLNSDKIHGRVEETYEDTDGNHIEGSYDITKQ